MGLYLNSDSILKKYTRLYKNEYFVDKSLIINQINKLIGSFDVYLCVTRPRRFGKTSLINMLGAYYSKAADSSQIFDTLKISQANGYREHLNKYNVISISFNEIPDNLKTYDQYINNITNQVKKEVISEFNLTDIEESDSLKRVLQKSKQQFIFLLDEWDYIFNNNLFEESQDKFLEFLRNLLKDESYVELCYMTGVLPIKKYSSGSALNMFDEFTFLKDRKFGEYFGFTEDEVLDLCEQNKYMDFKKLEEWYNGYTTARGIKIYNPRSVVKALKNDYCESYWTNTGAMDEVSQYLKYNVLEIRDDVIKMVSGQEIDITIDEEFRAGQGTPKTKEEIYSAMIVLGFLSYNDGYLKIPNKELMIEFEKALRDKSFGYVSEIIENSRTMLKATVNKDTKTVEQILHDIHNSEIPILQYNDENSLSCVITLAYLSARDTYRVEREEKTGKGYADFTFHPRRKNDTAFIVELKKDEVPEVAINKIREKEYIQKFKAENEGKEVLAVAICYDSKKKEHYCKIEEI
ncbi:MAG: AAA family ATPase [Intestinibacter bartlettii]|nr:AAA family ATPase [Intestinibacter bartlettii]